MSSSPGRSRFGPLAWVLVAAAAAALVGAATLAVRPGWFRAAAAAVGRAAEPGKARIREDLLETAGDPSVEPVEWYGPVFVTADHRLRAAALAAERRPPARAGGAASAPSDTAWGGLLRAIADADPGADTVVMAVRYRTRADGGGFAHRVRFYLMSDERLTAVRGEDVGEAGLNLFVEMGGSRDAGP